VEEAVIPDDGRLVDATAHPPSRDWRKTRKIAKAVIPEE
jgi:hypothetical protein